MKHEIALIGLFRSGTNFTRTLIERNFDAVVKYDTWGWKHGLMPTFTKDSNYTYEDAQVVQVVKDPYSTLISWFNYIKSNGKNIRGNSKSLSKFLSSPIYYYNESSKEVAPYYYFANPIQMWNTVTYNHLSFTEQMDGIVLRYEDIIENPKISIEKVATKFGIKSITSSFIVPDKVTRNMGDSGDRNKNQDYVTNKNFDKKQYFLGKKYLNEFEDKDMEFISKELDLNLLNKLDYEVELLNRQRYVIYTMCNDDRLISLCALLESNILHDNVTVKVIPFDDNIHNMKKLTQYYNLEIVKTDSKWDELGKAIFKQENYRPGIKAWRYFRKYNVFNESDEYFIFLDSNIVIFNSLKSVIGTLDPNSMSFGSKSILYRNFKPWFQFLLNSYAPNIGTGFNAGFWASNSDIFDNVDFSVYHEFPELRQCLKMSPEQSFLSLVISLVKPKVKMLTNELSEFHPMLSASYIDKKDIEVINNKKLLYKNKEVLVAKWKGTYFTKAEENMPNTHLLQELKYKSLLRLKEDEHLYTYLNDSLDKLGIEKKD